MSTCSLLIGKALKKKKKAELSHLVPEQEAESGDSTQAREVQILRVGMH